MVRNHSVVICILCNVTLCPTTFALRLNKPIADKEDRIDWGHMFEKEVNRDFEYMQTIRAKHTYKMSEATQQKNAYIQHVLPVLKRMRSCISQGKRSISQDAAGQVVVMTTFPNSGTTATLLMGKGIAGYSMGTCYRQEIIHRGLQSVSVPGMGGDFVFREANGGNASRRVLAKSHCKNFGEFIEKPSTCSIEECLGASEATLNRASVAGILQVVRNPVDTLIARQHLMQNLGRSDYTDAEFQTYYGKIKNDLRTHMRWLADANTRKQKLNTEVLWYEDLLMDPEKYADDLARILGVSADQRKDIDVDWVAFLRHGDDLQYVITEPTRELFPIYLSLYTPAILEDVGSLLEAELNLWTC